MRVSYPAGNGDLVLRTEQDWDTDIEPVSVSEDGNTWSFELEADQPFLYFKPCLVQGGEVHWAVGPNKLLLMEERDRRISYPCFFSSERGRFSDLSVWHHPEVFGAAVSMSSTFSHKDNLIDRVLNEPQCDVAFYLESGWPGDNYEVTLGMAMALVSRGWRYGRNVLHLCFPMAEHNEGAWGMRLHLPLQFLNLRGAPFRMTAEGSVGKTGSCALAEWRK